MDHTLGERGLHYTRKERLKTIAIRFVLGCSYGSDMLSQYNDAFNVQRKHWQLNMPKKHAATQVYVKGEPDHTWFWHRQRSVLLCPEAAQEQIARVRPLWGQEKEGRRVGML